MIFDTHNKGAVSSIQLVQRNFRGQENSMSLNKERPVQVYLTLNLVRINSRIPCVVTATGRKPGAAFTVNWRNLYDNENQ